MSGKTYPTIGSLFDRIALLEERVIGVAAKQAADDEMWAKSQYNQDGSVCIVFYPGGVRAKKCFKNGWVVQDGDTVASALRALRVEVGGDVR